LQLKLDKYSLAVIVGPRTIFDHDKNTWRMKSMVKILASMRRGLCSSVSVTILAFSVSLFHPQFSPIKRQTRADARPAASSLRPASQHQCACELNGLECRCQDDCCGESGASNGVFCQQLSPLAAPAAPNLPPVPPLRDYLHRKHEISIHFAFINFLMLMQQKPPSSWFAPPDSPPPRLLSGIC
jgi:hypothetical protein